jgi:hypothetical protein
MAKGTTAYLKEIARNTAALAPKSVGGRFRQLKWELTATANNHTQSWVVPENKEWEVACIYVLSIAVDANNRHFNLRAYGPDTGQFGYYYAIYSPVFNGSQNAHYYPSATYVVTAGAEWFFPIPEMRYYQHSTIELAWDCEVGDNIHANLFYTEYDSN